MLSILRAGAIALLCGAWGVQAEVVVSTSNPTGEELSDQIAMLFEAERDAISGVSPRRLDRLSRVPEASNDGGMFTRTFLASQPFKEGGAEWACLTEALYFEARGESVKGMFAVAEVIMNRVENNGYPDTVCGVINQGTGERYRCQFTYNCDGRAEVYNEPRAYERVGKVARLTLDGVVPDLTDGATHYHTKSVSPSWARVYPRTATIGYHHFYRQEYARAGG